MGNDFPKPRARQGARALIAPLLLLALPVALPVALPLAAPAADSAVASAAAPADTLAAPASPAAAPAAPSAPAADSGKNIFANVPIKNPRYPGFNDAGNRIYLLTGKQAAFINNRQIDIRELSFTQYPGDGSSTVQAAITAPTASVFFDDNRQSPRIAGSDSVHLVHENELDVTGEDWSYDHAQQKLNINKNARVICKAPLKNILGHATSAPLAPLAPPVPLAPLAPLAPPASPASSAQPRPGPDETHITADSLELTRNDTDTTTIAILTGNVTVIAPDDLRLTCDRLEVTATRLQDKNPVLTPADKFQLLVATGNVRLAQGARTVTCGRADVFPREDRITLTQSPVVTDTGLRMTAAGDPLTLHRTDRRIESRHGRFTFPPWETGQKTDAKKQNTDTKKQNTPDKKSPPEDTVVTAANCVMWETPDGLTHVKLDDNVTVAATDTRLTCDHLELTANPDNRTTNPDNRTTNSDNRTANSENRTANSENRAPQTTAFNSLQHLLATGNVHLMQADREATGGQAEVLPREDRIILTQNPILTDHAAAATASADTFTLHQLERRLTAGNNVRITTSPLKDLSAAARPSQTQTAPLSSAAPQTASLSSAAPQTASSQTVPPPSGAPQTASPQTASTRLDAPQIAPTQTVLPPPTTSDATADTPTIITSRTLTMWTTPDEISHATFDDDVRLAATNLDLTCNHLTIDTDPGRPVPPASAEDATLSPRMREAAAKTLSMVATGVVRFNQLSREASCERAEIIPPEDRITLTGKPLLIDRTNPRVTDTISGEKLVLIRGEQDISGEKIKISRTPVD
jgi:lipopolysaccharide export system protein LptA